MLSQRQNEDYKNETQGCDERLPASMYNSIQSRFSFGKVFCSLQNEVCHGQNCRVSLVSEGRVVERFMNNALRPENSIVKHASPS